METDAKGKQTLKSLGRAVKKSIDLMPRRDKRRYALVVLAQMATALMDLAGVLLIGILGATAAASMSDDAAPSKISNALDSIGLGNLSQEALIAVLGIAAAVLLWSKTLLFGLLARRTYRFLGRIQSDTSIRLIGGLLRQPLDFVEEWSSQQAIFAVTVGAACATTSILGSVAIILSEASLLLLLSISLLVLDPVVSLVAITFFLVIGGVLQRALARRSSELGRIAYETSVRNFEKLQEALASYREIVVARRRTLYVESIGASIAGGARATADIAFMSQLPKLVYEAALVVGALALFAWQFYTRDAVAAVATLALFLAAGSRVVPSMLRLSGQFLSMRNATAPASTTVDLSNRIRSADELRPSAVRDDADFTWTRSHDGFVPTLEIQELTVGYPMRERPVLSDVSLRAAAGSSIALVGSTGEGKSTLADAILGVRIPSTGSVLIGGLAPMAAISRWPGGLAYVPQTVALSNGTVRANIALGVPDEFVDDSLVWEVLSRVGLSEMLTQAREGLDTFVGEHGVRLSGGQRQRLGLARALFTAPKFLVLDEATSALDAESQEIVSDAIRDLHGEVTTVIIAHQLASVRSADLVVYLDGGAVAAMGTFDEVRLQAPGFDRQANLLGIHSV